MISKRWLVRLGAVVVTVLLASGLVATPASASHSCAPAGTISGWDSSDWSGCPEYYWTITAVGTGGCINIGSPWNDQFDSFKVNMWGSGYAILYRDHGCGGGTIATGTTTTLEYRLLNCHQQYNPWNTSIANCVPWTYDGLYQKVSSIWYYRSS